MIDYCPLLEVEGHHIGPMQYLTSDEGLVTKLQNQYVRNCPEGFISTKGKVACKCISDFCIFSVLSDGNRPPLSEPVWYQSFRSLLLLLAAIQDLLGQVWNQSWLLFLAPLGQQIHWFGVTGQHKVSRPDTQESQFPHKNKCCLFENLRANQVPETSKETFCYPKGFILEQI